MRMVASMLPLSAAARGDRVTAHRGMHHATHCVNKFTYFDVSVPTKCELVRKGANFFGVATGVFGLRRRQQMRLAAESGHNGGWRDACFSRDNSEIL